jgi:hypothetical protein
VARTESSKVSIGFFLGASEENILPERRRPWWEDRMIHINLKQSD